jgi:hypothetical protein
LRASQVKGAKMKKEYDFAKMQGKPNPYAKLLKKRKISWVAK